MTQFIKNRYPYKLDVFVASNIILNILPAIITIDIAADDTNISFVIIYINSLLKSDIDTINIDVNAHEAEHTDISTYAVILSLYLLMFFISSRILSRSYASINVTAVQPHIKQLIINDNISIMSIVNFGIII